MAGAYCITTMLKDGELLKVRNIFNCVTVPPLHRRACFTAPPLPTHAPAHELEQQRNERRREACHQEDPGQGARGPEPSKEEDEHQSVITRLLGTTVVNWYQRWYSRGMQGKRSSSRR